MEIDLRPLKEEDALKIVTWRNNPAVKRNLYSQKDISVEEHLNYYHNIVEKGKCFQFIITVPESGQDVGTTFIKNIDYENKSGEFGIFIGEDAFRGKGIGKQATEKILKFSFETLKLNKVWLTVFADNEKAIQCYTNVGYRKCAYYREEIIRCGKFYDVIGMEYIKKDWDITSTI